MWTEQQDDLLSKLWKEGKSASKIAESLPGRSRNAVIGRVHRLRASGAHFSERPHDPCKPRKPYVPRERVTKVKPQGPPRPRNWVIRLVPNEPFLPPKPLPVIVDTLEGSADFHERTGCKWPVTASPPHRFCNRVAREDSPYCDGHALRAYQPREMKRGKHEVPFQ